MIATDRIEDWFAAGERVDAGGFKLFERVAGREDAPWLTLLHGYPTCSWDWSPVADTLAEARRLLMPDFLGFGDSDKPADHDYSIHEQADLTEALWRRHGIERTALVVHDYAVSVGQELLARHAEGALGVEIERIAFLNGGLYPDMHRALLAQQLLLNPRTGPIVTRTMSERTLGRAFRRIFAHRAVGRRDARALARPLSSRRRPHPAPADPLHRRPPRARGALDRRPRADGRAAAVRLGDARPGLRRAHGRADRGTGARRALHALTDVGHYPQLEAPERAGLLLREWLG